MALGRREQGRYERHRCLRREVRGRRRRDAETPQTPSLCPRNVAWNDGIALAVSTGQDTFGAVTPDELTIVWTAGAATPSPSIHWADRANPSVPFASAGTLPLAPGTFLAGALAVSPDGLHLALQAPDSSFLLVSRTDRSSAFDASAMPSDLPQSMGRWSGRRP